MPYFSALTVHMTTATAVNRGPGFFWTSPEDFESVYAVFLRSVIHCMICMQPKPRGLGPFWSEPAREPRFPIPALRLSRSRYMTILPVRLMICWLPAKGLMRAPDEFEN